MDQLSPADFPLVANGQYVYRRTSSSPICGPINMHLAQDLAFRLNRDHAASSNPSVSGASSVTMLVYGRG